MTPVYRRVDLRSGPWRADGVAVATTFAGRFLGRAGSGPGGLLLPVTCVHTMGCRRPILVSAISSDGVATTSVPVAPWRIRRFRAAAWILELDATAEPPPAGVPLTIEACATT